jgi:hypothetical protein
LSARSIGGALDLSALSRMHFHSLDHAEQAAAIRRLAALGQSELTIAAATGLSVEAIRQVLAPQSQEALP